MWNLDLKREKKGHKQKRGTAEGRGDHWQVGVRTERIKGENTIKVHYMHI
jgi:stress-induced morphogen